MFVQKSRFIRYVGGQRIQRSFRTDICVEQLCTVCGYNIIRTHIHTRAHEGLNFPMASVPAKGPVAAAAAAAVTVIP